MENELKENWELCPTCKGERVLTLCPTCYGSKIVSTITGQPPRFVPSANINIEYKGFDNKENLTL